MQCPLCPTCSSYHSGTFFPALMRWCQCSAEKGRVNLGHLCDGRDPQMRRGWGIWGPGVKRYTDEKVSVEEDRGPGGWDLQVLGMCLMERGEAGWVSFFFLPRMEIRQDIKVHSAPGGKFLAEKWAILSCGEKSASSAYLLGFAVFLELLECGWRQVHPFEA